MRAFFICLFFASLTAVASQLPDYPFVTVTGYATKEVAPDKGTITFQVKTFDPTAERCYQQQSEIAASVISFATNLGLPTESIVAQEIEKSVVRKEDSNGKELEIVGYETVRTVAVELQTLECFPRLIEFLYRAPNVEKISASFGSKNEPEIIQALTAEACRKATTDAELMAKGFGRKLGAVRAVSEVSFTELEDRFLRTRSAYTVASASGVGVERKDFRVIPAKIPFQKFVHAIFALE